MEGIRAEYLCAVAERFGQPPHVVAGWPASTMRLLEADALMRRARKQMTEAAS